MDRQQPSGNARTDRQGTKRLFVARSERQRSKVTTEKFVKVDSDTGEFIVDAVGKEIKIAVEVLADGQQFIAGGIHPDTGREYTWPGDSILDYRADELPVVGDALIDDLMAFAELTLQRYFIPSSPAPGPTDSRKLNFDNGSKPSLSQIADALTFISADDYVRWITIGLALRNSYGNSPEVFEVWRAWSATSDEYQVSGKNDCAAKWASFKEPAEGAKRVAIGTIIYFAKQAGWPGLVISDGAIEELNNEYAVVVVGGKTSIIREYIDEDGEPSFDLLSVESFKQWLGNRWVAKGDKMVLLANEWMKSDRRRQYLGMVFAPKGTPTNYFNLWRGFGVEPNNSGSCQKFLDHILENVCCNDRDLFDWVVGWIAHIVQHPQDKLGVSLVLRGKQGTGKTVVGNVFGKLFGPHYVQVADPRYIVGQFNSHLSRCLLLHCDEGFWAGDRGAEGKLKDLVTGSHQLIEFKGKEPIRLRNFVRLLITSNHGWVVPSALEERRFCVLDVCEAYMQDQDYFASMFEELEDGGYEALLYHLQTLDLSSVNLRKVPDTTALAEQKLATMNAEQSWWFDCLRNGTVCDQDENWRQIVGCKEVRDSYLMHASKRGVKRKSDEVTLGIALKTLAPKFERKRRTFDKWIKAEAGHWKMEPTLEYAYLLPPLDECRAYFKNLVQMAIDWNCDDT